MREPVQGGIFTRSYICCEKRGCCSVRPQRRVYIWTFLWWLRPAGRWAATALLSQTLSRLAGPKCNYPSLTMSHHPAKPDSSLQMGPAEWINPPLGAVSHIQFGKIPTICHFSNPACAGGAGKHTPVTRCLIWIFGGALWGNGCSDRPLQQLSLSLLLTVICCSEYKPLS